MHVDKNKYYLFVRKEKTFSRKLIDVLYYRVRANITLCARIKYRKIPALETLCARVT